MNHAVYFYLSKVKKQERLLTLFRCTFIEGYKVKQRNEQSMSNAWGRRMWWKRRWGTKSFQRNQVMLPVWFDLVSLKPFKYMDIYSPLWKTSLDKNSNYN